jgi:Probable lipoprotein LpqN
VKFRRGIAALALVATFGACSTKPPDYQSIWSTSSTSPSNPSKPVPIAQYLQQQGVDGQPMTPDTLTDIKVSMPQPPGWTVVTDPNQPSAFQILRKTGPAAYPPTALLLVFKLTGNFDSAEAIKHGYVDAELSQNFIRLNASMDNFHGFPSAMIEGSYDLGNQRLHTYNRVVIPNGPPPANQRYLVQFQVTSAAGEAQAQGPDVEKIIGGFTVATR